MGWLVFNNKTEEIMFFADCYDAIAHKNAHRDSIGRIVRANLATELSKAARHNVYIQVNPGSVV